jgi:hypothetical protein
MPWWAGLLRGMGSGGARRSLPPRSANGASSFHLVWELSNQEAAAAPLVEVSAVLEVLTPPSVPALYFWALQVDFADSRGIWGGGHTGLQWNIRYPGATAVNWGGYASPEHGGAVLAGTDSALPGFPDDPNTLAYRWAPGRPYRLRVCRSPDIAGAWRSEVTDLESGVSTVVRDLLPARGGAGKGHLVRPIVWSEVFADCYAPSVSVRWRDLAARDEAGSEIRPAAVGVNYQSWNAGGCPNTSALPDENAAILQVTNTERKVPQGARMLVPQPGGRSADSRR